MLNLPLVEGQLSSSLHLNERKTKAIEMNINALDLILCHFIKLSGLDKFKELLSTSCRTLYGEAIALVSCCIKRLPIKKRLPL